MENKKVTAKSKLRSTEIELNCGKHTAHSISSLQTDYGSASSSHIEPNQSAVQNTYNPNTTFKPQPKMKSVGRGMAIQQMCQPIINTIDRLQNIDFDYSNSSIEQHFKNLREKKQIKNKQQNEEKWGYMLHSNK